MGKKKRNQSAGTESVKNGQRAPDFEDIEMINCHFFTSKKTIKPPKNTHIVYDLLTQFEIEEMFEAINKLDKPPMEAPSRIHPYSALKRGNSPKSIK